MDLDEEFMYLIEKLNIIEDIENFYKDPEMNRQYKKWLEARNKKDLKQISSKSNLTTQKL